MHHWWWTVGLVLAQALWIGWRNNRRERQQRWHAQLTRIRAERAFGSKAAND